MHQYYMLVALQLASDRAAEANARRLASLAHPGEARTAGVRRMVARVALAVARAADDEVGRVALSSN